MSSPTNAPFTAPPAMAPSGSGVVDHGPTMTPPAPSPSAARPRVVLAPDGFKGSVSSGEVAAALCEGILSTCPDADVRTVPVADGGDGTVEAVLAAGWQPRTAPVTGPWGDRHAATWARSADGSTALLELAAASGMSLTGQPSRPDDGPTRALTATSTGTGELMAAALDVGCRQLIVGVGGSACSDGGAGLLTALGARVLDGEGRPVPPGVPGLEQAAKLDLDPARERLTATRLTLAADVTNPLLGPTGAAAVYGPQKGADAVTVARTDAALARWSTLLADAGCAPDLAERAGSGAAGGVGLALLAMGAQHASGIDLLLDLVGLDDELVGADLVVTGEGRLDAQTLHGKAPAGVLARARAAGVPVLAVCGTSELTASDVADAGFAGVRTLREIEPDLQRCLDDPAPLLARIGADLGRGLRGRPTD